MGRHARDGNIEPTVAVPWRKRPRPPLWSFDTSAGTIVPPALAVGSVGAAVLAASAGSAVAAVIWGLIACALVALCVTYLRRPVAKRSPEGEVIDWTRPHDAA